jgi:hypothetical protein
MNPRRSKRGWLAGLFAGVAAVGTVLLLHGLFELIDRAPVPPQAFSPQAEWYDLALIRMEYLGRDPAGMIEAKSSLAVGMLFALGAVFLVTVIGTWWAARGSTPGSSVFPVFLSTWASFIIGATVGRFGQSLWNLRDDLDTDGILLSTTDYAIRAGADYGLVWGFHIALLTALLWLIVRPRAERQPAGFPPPGQQQPPYGQQPPPQDNEEPMWATTVEDPPYDPAHDTRAAPGSHADQADQADDGPDLTKRPD